MAPVERDAPVDKSLRHSHSASSDHGRALIPMWDSSDPERAPPPLPLNPQSPSLTSRAGTSSAIQSAHAALTERARESAVVTHALGKRTSVDGSGSPEKYRPSSPEKSLVKGSHHRRMQSLQPGTVRDLSLMIEGGHGPASPSMRSPEKASRPSTPARGRERDRDRDRDPFHDPKPDEREQKRSFVGLSPGPSLTPIIRPTVRRPPQSILGENTPPQSATMLALQNMPAPPPPKEPEAPLSNVTNGSNAVAKTAQPFESLSTQILSLTSIATALQKEMSQLSRRSRDNATDLMSLKEATHARDEDIRKSLRELVTTLPERASTRDPYGGALLLEGRPHHSTSPSFSKATRPFSLPRIPSPNSFAASLDRETVSTPSLYNSDAPATIALLEKILREMSTKEGVENLVSRLTEVAGQLQGMATQEKIEDLRQLVKANQDQSLVPSGGGGGGRAGTGRPRNFSFDEDPRSELEYGRSETGPMTHQGDRSMREGRDQRNSASSSKGANIINEDILKIIRSVKDSVAQGGGLTAEVKALVRELRGEVLGMGREIGRRLDEVQDRSDKQSKAASKQDMARIVEEGLDELKHHMNNLLREHRRQSANSMSSKASAVDYQEIYNAMRAAITDSNKNRMPDLKRDDVLQAVKEAWENYKPEIQVEQIGLERDEVLACLKEGLQEYSRRDEPPAAATREEVFKAVIEGLKHFVPPEVDNPSSLSRDEILDAVRECLEEFEFPVAPSAMGADITKEDMVNAVKQGLNAFDFPNHSNESALVPHSAINDEVAGRLRDIMDFLREEFKAVSEEAKENVAANGRDTEQVLDATRDGFDKLRQDVESYVDRASGVAGQEEFMDGLVRSLDNFREEVADLVVKASASSQDMLHAELENLRDTVNSAVVPIAPQGNHKDILEALHDGLTSIRAEINHRPIAGTTEVIDALQEGMDDLRVSIERLHNKPQDLTANDEILDALRSGLDNLRSEMDELRQQSHTGNALVPLGNNDVLDALKSGLEGVRSEIDTLRETRTEMTVAPLPNNEVLETLTAGLEQIRSDIDSLREQNRPEPAAAPAANDEVLESVTVGFESIRSEIDNLREQTRTEASGAPVANDEVLEALTAGFDSIRLEIDGLREQNRSETTDAPLANDEVLETLASGLDGIRLEIETLREQDQPEVVVPNLEILEALTAGLEGIRSEMDVLREQTKPENAVKPPGNEDVLEALKSGLDGVRADIDKLRELSHPENAIVPIAKEDEKDEVLDTLKSGLETIRSDIDALRNQNNAEGAVGNDELLGTLKSGLESLRAEMDSLREQSNPENAVASVANNEILDALRSGLDGVRSELDVIREQNRPDNALVPLAKDDALKTDDIKNLEVLITQLRIKVEAMEPVPPATDPVSKDDLSPLEEAIKNLEASIAGLALEKEAAEKEEAEKEAGEEAAERAATDPASREDVEAIETILRNTKARLDDLVDGEQAVRKDHIDALETLLLETRESLSSLTTQLESVPGSVTSHMDTVSGALTTHLDTVSRKEDLEKLESIIAQVANGFEEMKERHEKQLEDPDKVTKTDVEAVESVCRDVQSTIDQMLKSDIAVLPTKEDLSSLETIVIEFRDRMATHTEGVDKAFEERQAETVGVGERVTEVKDFLTEFQELVKGKLEEGATGVEALSKSLENMGETISQNANVGTDLKEMFDTMKTEFEESKAGLVGAKEETDEKLQQTTETLGTKIDEKIAELMGKYEEFQLVLDERARLGEARDTEMEAAVVGTKAVTDELKTLIDTLGSTVTDSLDKMEEASKTVFTRVEDLMLKSDDNHTDDKAEHQLTRDDVKQAISTIEGVQGHVVEYQPKILDAIKDVLDMVGQHFEHTKTSVAEVQERIVEKIEEAKPPEQPLLPPPEKYDDTQMHEKLDLLVSHTEVAGKAYAQLDTLDTQMIEKLDVLVDHTHVAGQAYAQLETLDKVHQQVLQTAAEISEFITAQKQRITDEHEDREKTLQETEKDLQETVVALERRLAQKDQVEASIATLHEEEERLKGSVLGLRAEQETLTRQKMRLTGDVSSLETALRLRREELHEMESRAEGLERRILEGVMDHSRILLMTKQNKRAEEVMNRKRVPSSKPRDSAKNTPTKRENKPPAAAVNFALSAKRNLATPNTTPRRILSLSQINNNVPAGGFKRSQSVRTPGGAGGLRKRSWGGRAPAAKGYGDLDKGLDKENVREVDEDSLDEVTVPAPEPPQDEITVVNPSDLDGEGLGDGSVSGDDAADAGHSDDGDVSDTETLRRSSLGTGWTGTENGTELSYTDNGTELSYTDNGTELSYSDDDASSTWTESAVGTASSIAGEGDGAGGEVVVYGG